MIPSKLLNQQMRAKMKKQMTDFYADNTGSTAVEYGVMTATIAIGIVYAATQFGAAMNGMITRLNFFLDTGQWIDNQSFHYY